MIFFMGKRLSAPHLAVVLLGEVAECPDAPLDPTGGLQAGARQGGRQGGSRHPLRGPPGLPGRPARRPREPALPPPHPAARRRGLTASPVWRRPLTRAPPRSCGRQARPPRPASLADTTTECWRQIMSRQTLSLTGTTVSQAGATPTDGRPVRRATPHDTLVVKVRGALRSETRLRLASTLLIKQWKLCSFARPLALLHARWYFEAGQRHLTLHRGV